MSEPQPKLFSNQIIIEDNCQFNYTVKPYEILNAIGNLIAILQEYNFIKTDDTNEKLFGKLYKTTEGNWYDLEQEQSATYKKILRMLKSAIDAKENTRALTGIK